MASYLTYYISCTCDLTPLPHRVWSEEVTIFQYCPLLQKDRVLEDFRKVHDLLMENAFMSLNNMSMPKLSPKAQRLIQPYGSYFIHFPWFTYLRIGGFKEEPTKFPWYALDCFVLAEICRQLFSVLKDNLPQEDWEIAFPIKLGLLVCNRITNSSLIGSNFLGFNYGFYHSRRSFDNKGYAA